jgi:hypothetical protein
MTTTEPTKPLDVQRELLFILNEGVDFSAGGRCGEHRAARCARDGNCVSHALATLRDISREGAGRSCAARANSSFDLLYD